VSFGVNLIFSRTPYLRRGHPTPSGNSQIEEKEMSMAKVLRCNDVVGNCDFEARGESEQDVMEQAADHARTTHHLNEVTPELAEKARSAIRDEAA
jgi:predicted small metal-binding protein